MDFLGRNANNQPQTVRANGGGQASTTNAATTADKNKRGMYNEPRWLKIGFLIMLFSLTVLALIIAVLLYYGKPKEAHYVDKTKEQAVFLTNGQVYFGKIADITDKYVNLIGIYYLNSTSDSANKTAQTSFSLVKLGCELHGPTDQMVINRDQVSFWENLKTDGKVTKAIQQWISQNPTQTCTNSNSTNTTQQSNTATPTTQTTTKP